MLEGVEENLEKSGSTGAAGSSGLSGGPASAFGPAVL